MSKIRKNESQLLILKKNYHHILLTSIVFLLIAYCTTHYIRLLSRLLPAYYPANQSCFLVSSS